MLTPTGILVGLLYYFGYVTTDAWFRYFGLDLNQVQLSQQAIVLQSIAALYLPLGALLALGLGVYFARRGLDALLEAGWRPAVMRVGGIVAALAGSALIVRALVGVFVPDVARTEPLAMSPLSLCAGVLLLAGGVGVVRRTHRPRTAAADRSMAPTLLVGALVVLGLFWATNSVAGAYGRGRAMDFARSLVRPSGRRAGHQGAPVRARRPRRGVCTHPRGRRRLPVPVPEPATVVRFGGSALPGAGELATRVPAP